MLNKDHIHSIFIDTSTKYLILGYLDGSDVKDFVKIPTNNNMTAITHNEIEKFFRANGLTFNDIERIFLTNGPGSFVGLRVTMAIIKMWYLINPKIKLYVLSSLQLQTINPSQQSAITAGGGKSYLRDLKGGEKIVESNTIPLIKGFVEQDNIIVSEKYLQLNLKNFKFVKFDDLKINYLKVAI